MIKKRAKARQHTRKLKSGKTVTVNKGVTKKSVPYGTKKVPPKSAAGDTTYNKEWESLHKKDLEDSEIKKAIDDHIKKYALKISDAKDLKAGSTIHYEDKGSFVTATVKEVKMMRHSLFGSNRKGEPSLTVVTESGKQHPVNSGYLIKKLPPKALIKKYSDSWHSGRSLMDPRNSPSGMVDYHKSYSAYKKLKNPKG